jgi:hypothetical protein
MARRILDPALVTKLSNKLGRPENAISVMVSKKAHQIGISSEAALILLAKQNGIGTAIYQRKLDATKQAEVRDALPAMFGASNQRERPAGQGKSTGNRPAAPSKKAQLKAAIEYLIEDPVLLSRCQDLLLASANFDRPINQATLVLEDRIRNRAQPTKKLVGEPLVGYAFNPDISQSVLRVSSNDPEDQRGFAQIMRGIVPAFRNKTHHHLTDAFSREDAMRVCGFIDVLLHIVDDCIKAK